MPPFQMSKMKFKLPLIQWLEDSKICSHLLLFHLSHNCHMELWPINLTNSTSQSILHLASSSNPQLSELISRPFILLICTTVFTHLLTSPLSLSPSRPIFTLLPEHFSKMVRLCHSYYFKISSGSPLEIPQWGIFPTINRANTSCQDYKLSS